LIEGESARQSPVTPFSSLSIDTEFKHAVRTQLRVIGALMMRELHTRFGRDNIGYLWVFIEPMILAIAVTSIHVGGGSRSAFGMDPAPFWITGYTPFIMFRGIVARSEGALESNRSLLYHRSVTITDMLIARAILEGLVTTFAIFLLLGGAAVLGMGTMPGRPLLFLAGLGFMLWFSFGVSCLVCVGVELSATIGRFIHPAIYISLPLSGAFFLITWIPEPYRTWLTWFPMMHIFELIREGEYPFYDSAYIDLPYLAKWCMFLTVAGLISVRFIRRRLDLG
jgi:capsular polysaccharide transport system permease protein